MTRLRYNKNESGVSISKSVSGSLGDLIVNINPDGTFVINFVNGTLYEKSDALVPVSTAKKLAKVVLKAAGVKFEDEVRSKIETTEEVKGE